MANCAHDEPTIDEILADPAVKALMLADGVNPHRLRRSLLKMEADGRRPASPQERRGSSWSHLCAGSGETAARAVWG
ncbi:hypothetical protein ASG43_09755 [Aureimonas sp. Leaf454]|uniref:hypothetical protein n=1 Tax=Aureimonas sp. Leaf454 TaxID=1736381 RepID=UPI0006FF929E|nr:hypothetical protein [Aureimonas sp. Leaf454]KQT47398.1 hypothetical protein ASG43_09755 [Aureimonas sp. Leaf454]